MKELTVNFSAQKKSIKVAQGTDVLTAAIKSGIMMHASCGGEGLCGRIFGSRCGVWRLIRA